MTSFGFIFLLSEHPGCYVLLKTSSQPHARFFPNSNHGLILTQSLICCSSGQRGGKINRDSFGRAISTLLTPLNLTLHLGQWGCGGCPSPAWMYAPSPSWQGQQARWKSYFMILLMFLKPFKNRCLLYVNAGKRRTQQLRSW